MTKWAEITKATEAQPSERGLYHFTMGAEDNAYCTIYEEKAAPVSELEALCFRSLEGLLANSDDRNAHAFFAALGVRF